MAITPDQEATLQLLLERGQRYADLAKLLGVDEDEVRARARSALTELGGGDPDRKVGLTDYLLGQADPIGRADASRHLKEDAEDHALATALAERLRELFPAAQLPRLPGEPRPARRARRAPAAGEPASAPLASRLRPSGLSPQQTRLIVVVGSVAVLLIAVVLAITGAFGGGDDDSSTASESATTTAATDDEIERVELSAQGGGDARGEAVFGLATGDQPFVDFAIEGLDPAPQGQQYVIWLMLTADQGYPLSPIAVSQQGTYQNRFPIPSAVLPVVARVRFVDVSIAAEQEIRRTVEEAIRNTSLVLEKPGETVLRGSIPRGSQPAGS